jgi:hypothetical protein
VVPVKVKLTRETYFLRENVLAVLAELTLAGAIGEAISTPSRERSSDGTRSPEAFSSKMILNL